MCLLVFLPAVELSAVATGKAVSLTFSLFKRSFWRLRKTCTQYALVDAVASTSSANRNSVSFLDKAKHRLGVAKWIWHIQVSQLNNFDDAYCDTMIL
jgi:hypothetical protein